MKQCSRCNNYKELSEFYRQKSSKDGVCCHCKKCDNRRKTEYLRKKSIDNGKKQRTYTLVSKALREQGLKKCPKCKEIKSLDSFYNNRLDAHGKMGYCMICANQIAKNRPKQESKERYQRNKKYVRDGHIRYKFGITLKEYNDISIAQNNTCAICDQTNGKRDLVIDHCHRTGKIRGLLCNVCNVGIGMLKDNIHIMKKAISYLEKNNGIFENI